MPSDMSEPSTSGGQENAPSTSQAGLGATVNNLQNSQETSWEKKHSLWL